MKWMCDKNIFWHLIQSYKLRELKSKLVTVCVTFKFYFFLFMKETNYSVFSADFIISVLQRSLKSAAVSNS
jgi:hypothetical protein